MNPKTGEFEPLTALTDAPAIERELGKLLKPDGEPVPDTWLICGVGDLVTVERNGRSFTFKVVYLGEKILLLESVDPIVGNP